MLAATLAAPSFGLAQAVDNGHHPVWAPNGRIYFHVVQGQDVSIYSVDPQGSHPRRLTTPPGRERSIPWSPDGEVAVLMAADGDDLYDIHVPEPDGSGRLLVVRPGHDWDPVFSWSPDGAWLAFESDRSGTTHVYRIRPGGTGLRQLTGPASGQQASDPCTTDVAGQFDFWIGEWTVTQEIATEDGGWETYQARSTVSPALGGCALVERWEGTVRFYWEGMTEPEWMEGLSVRAPDADGSWRINWMDSRDPTFGAPWVGGFSSGEGAFLRSTDSGTLTRIRFFDMRETSVEWELAVSVNRGSTWTPLWKMHFRRNG